MKKIVFFNPHLGIWFKQPVYMWLTRRRSIKKYEYIFDGYLNEHNHIDVFLSSGSSSFPRFFRHIYGNKIFVLIEFLIWCKINRVPVYKVSIHFDNKKLDHRDILFLFLYENLSYVKVDNSSDYAKIVDVLNQVKIKKMLHCTHYMYNWQFASFNLSRLNDYCLIAENNLARNSIFFNTHIKDAEFYTLPFAASKRFNNYKLFESRINKVIATGTITYPIQDTEFNKYFGHGDIHPMRKEIYEKKSLIQNYIDSYISPINEIDNNKNSLTKISKCKLFEKIYKLLYDKQTKYFSFDIVEKYNDYRMFVVPEEINDLPGIGFVEGMMCGSAFIGKNDPMYTDLGMIPDYHYIAYNNTIEDLVAKISYYQQHEQELKKIAKQGYEFALNNFTGEKVVRKFIEILDRINL